MSKFKIGDKVRIIELFYNSAHCANYRGRVATITNIYKDKNEQTIPCTDGCYYTIDLDKGMYRWFVYDFELYKEQSNTYGIHNLINDFPTETKFLSNGHLFKIQLGELQTYDEDTQEWRKSINSLKQILDMKFTKVEEPKLKPMTFEEAVRTGNKIKYESEIQRNFEPVNKIIEIITKYSPSWIVKEIFLGTWYAEGVYE